MNKFILGMIVVAIAFSISGCSWKQIGSVAGEVERSGCKNFGGC